MKKVLVTGGTGFIGRHCLPMLLDKGFEVHAVSSRPIEKKEPSINWHQVNLLATREVELLMSRVKPSYLLHLAWYVTPGKYWTSNENLRWVGASLELLRNFEQCGGERLVVAGTCAEYDWRYGYCSEKITPLAPKTLYGSCKHALQLMLNEYAKQTEISIAWGRIFYPYGPYEYPDRLIPYVILSLLKGKPALCSHGNQIQDFMFVKDTADAFSALLDCDVSGPVNIASGKLNALKDIIFKIAEKLGNKDLIKLGAVPPSKDEPLLLAADTSRLTSEVGWSGKYDLDSGLDETIKWWTDSINPGES